MSKNKVETIVWNDKQTQYKSTIAELWRDEPITGIEAMCFLESTIARIDAAAAALTGVGKVATSLHAMHPTGRAAVEALDAVEALLHDIKESYFDNGVFVQFKNL